MGKIKEIKIIEVKDSDGELMGNTDTYSDSDIESNSLTKTENKVNSEESLTLENYEKCKSIIEKRLNYLNVEDYNLSLDTQNGTITLQIPEDSETDHTVSNILQISKFEIRDSEDSSNVFITNDNIKDISSAYNTDQNGTIVYLQIAFNKEGTNKLKELSTGEYATKPEDESENEENTESENETTDENAVEAETEMQNEEEDSNNENATKEDKENTADEASTENSSEESTDENAEEEQKKIVLAIDTNDMITTSFDDPIENGIISLSMGRATTDSEEISDQLRSTSTIALLVKSGKMPLTYKISTNSYINTDITENTIQKILIVTGVIILIGLVIYIIKYKLKGLIAAIAYIGFIALYLLIIRYTNVEVTMESITASVIIFIINYILTYSLLNKKEDKINVDKLKSWIMRLLPIFIISIVFVFIKWTKITTFGMNMFWGILLSIIYSYLLTRDMLD